MSLTRQSLSANHNGFRGRHAVLCAEAAVEVSHMQLKLYTAAAGGGDCIRRRSSIVDVWPVALCCMVRTASACGLSLC